MTNFYFKDNTYSSSKKLNKIHYLITITLIAIQTFYPLKAIIPSIIIIPIYFIWLIISCISDRSYLFKLISKTYILIYFILWITIRVILSNNIDFSYFGMINVIISFVNLFIYYSIYIFISNIDLSQKRKLILSILIFLIVTNILSIYYVTKDENAIRYAKSNLYFGVGDFELVYSVVLLIPILIFCSYKYFKNIKIGIRRILIIEIIVSIILILKANYMTAIVMTVYMIPCVIYLGKNNKILKFFMFQIFILLGVFIIKNLIIEACLYIINNTSIFSEIINTKIMAIANFLSGGGAVDTIDNRMELSNISFNTFINNPLIGVDFSQYGRTVIGSHATWVDSLARFGIIGVSIIIVFLYKIFKNIVSNCKNKLDRNCIIISIFGFLILGFINNNMMSGVFVVIFIVAPFMSSILRYEK